MSENSSSGATPSTPILGSAERAHGVMMFFAFGVLYVSRSSIIDDTLTELCSPSSVPASYDFIQSLSISKADPILLGLTELS